MTGSAEPKIILAVDDTPFFLNTLKSLLADMPYKLICVTSGKDALRVIGTKQPDLFILDIEMPDMDGYELAGKIREAGQTAPIIFLTGNTAPEYAEKALEKGASALVTKPIQKEILVAEIIKNI